MISQERQRWLLRVYLAAMTADIGLYFSFPGLHSVTWGALGLLSAMAIFGGMIMNRSSGRLGWGLLGLAVLTFVSGDTAYNILTNVFHQENPFPSVADGFYLVTYPLFAVGLHIFNRRRQIEADRGGLIDAAIITVGIGLLSWVLLIVPYVQSAELTLLDKAFSIAYPLGDILMLAMLSRLLIGGGLRSRSAQLLTLGSLGMLVSDALYGWIQLHGTWNVGGPVDIGWVTFYVLWGAAALHPSMTSVTQPQAAAQMQLSRGRLGVLTAVTLIAPIVRLTDLGGKLPFDSHVIAVLSAVLCLLVIGRLVGMVRAYDHGLERERVIRAAAASLVSASDEAGAFAAVEVAITALAATGSDRSRPRALTIPPAAQSLLARIEAHTRAGVSELPPAMLAELGCEDAGSALICPIQGQGRPVGAVVLAGEPVVLASLRPGLEMLASQAALALDRILLDAQYKHRAFHDGLTGLANRDLYMDRIDNALARLDRTHAVVGVVLIDVDDFKEINDTLGHACGDEILIAMGQRLTGMLRRGDTAARLGGDEFAILIEGLSQKDTTVATQRVVEELSGTYPSSSGPVTVTVSVGLATSQDGAASDELLRYADLALYAAKEMGKNVWRGFEPDLQTGMIKRLEMRAGLLEALAGNQFEVHYQPIVDLSDGRLSGLEALVRWEHPVRGTISPAEFIPVAEETGMIVEIGELVLNTAMAQMSRWNQDRNAGTELRISVNVSPRQLYGSDFYATVERALAASQLPATLLTLELTEGVLLRNDTHVSDTLHKLRRLGIQLAVDDFGTGYSALGYLRDFPVTSVKIDRSFVSGLPGSAQQGALVDAIVRMSKSMNLQVVAEGIEVLAHEDAVTGFGCNFGQGYLYSTPLSAQDTEKSLLFEASRTGAVQVVGPLPGLAPPVPAPRPADRLPEESR